MIVLKNLEIEESLTKPSVTLRKNHECAYCGETIEKGHKAIQCSFRYDSKLYPIYFHVDFDKNIFCFSHFRKANIKTKQIESLFTD